MCHCTMYILSDVRSTASAHFYDRRKAVLFGIEVKKAAFLVSVHGRDGRVLTDASKRMHGDNST
jgi:hypothetical protein